MVLREGDDRRGDVQRTELQCGCADGTCILGPARLEEHGHLPQEAARAHALEYMSHHKPHGVPKVPAARGPCQGESPDLLQERGPPFMVGEANQVICFAVVGDDGHPGTRGAVTPTDFHLHQQS